MLDAFIHSSNVVSSTSTKNFEATIYLNNLYANKLIDGMINMRLNILRQLNQKFFTINSGELLINFESPLKTAK